MAKSDQRRRSQKDKKQKKAAERDKRRDAWRREKSQFQRRAGIWPTLEIDFIDGRNAKFQNAVVEAWKKSAFAPELEGEKLRDIELAKSRGFYNTKHGPLNWSMWLGELLHRELTYSVSPVVYRRHDIQVIPTERRRSHVKIQVQSLLRVQPGVACSPTRPVVEIDGQSVVVAFNLKEDEHFIRRLEERTVANAQNFKCKGQVFACLYRWQFFDPTTLPNGQCAARLWNWCDPKVPLAKFWLDALNEPVEVVEHQGVKFLENDSGRSHYLVGYCPINSNKLGDGIAVLNTLLLPGMRNTPERKLLCRGLSKREAQDFDRVAVEQTYAHLTKTENFKFLRDCHAVVPQVRILSESVFDYSR